MIFKDLKIFSQNVQKNNLIVNTILELKMDFDNYLHSRTFLVNHLYNS